MGCLFICWLSGMGCSLKNQDSLRAGSTARPLLRPGCARHTGTFAENNDHDRGVWSGTGLCHDPATIGFGVKGDQPAGRLRSGGGRHTARGVR